MHVAFLYRESSLGHLRRIRIVGPVPPRSECPHAVTLPWASSAAKDSVEKIVRMPVSGGTTIGEPKRWVDPHAVTVPWASKAAKAQSAEKIVRIPVSPGGAVPPPLRNPQT